MLRITQKVIGEVESALEVSVVVLVADNEYANRGMFTQLISWRLSLVCLGCNAHGWQLVLADLLTSIPLVKTAMAAVDRVLRVFQRNPNMQEMLIHKSDKHY